MSNCNIYTLHKGSGVGKSLHKKGKPTHQIKLISSYTNKELEQALGRPSLWKLKKVKYIIYGTDNRLTYSPHFYYTLDDKMFTEWEHGYKSAFRLNNLQGMEIVVGFLESKYPHMTFHIQEIHE